MIWHIYSGQRCFQGDGGMDLPSSGGDVLPTGKVPCEFRTDPPTFDFQGKVETSRRAASSPREGASSAAGGSDTGGIRLLSP